jgi:aarF domain-containing kinase
MELSDGRLGLIDFGQTRILTDEERLGIAQIVVDVGRGADSHEIAESMRRAGFRTEFDGDDALAQYATLFFDSDFKFKEKGFSTPQHYFAELMETDKLVDIPDAASKLTPCSLLDLLFSLPRISSFCCLKHCS